MPNETYSFTASAVFPTGYEPDTRSRFRKVLDWLRRRPFDPEPIYPEGTQSLMFKGENGLVYYLPAVRFGTGTLGPAEEGNDE